LISDSTASQLLSVAEAADLFGHSQSEILQMLEKRRGIVLPSSPGKLQYTRRETAEMLSVGLRTLDRLIAEKEITVRRIGRRVVITREALAQFTRRDHPTN
jgi:excisionase family DNA binding protein